MTEAVRLWRRDADPALNVPPVYVAGYHLETDSPYLAYPLALATAREEALAALADKTDALLDAVRKFVKKDTPTGLMRLNDAMVYARDAMLAARLALTAAARAKGGNDA